MATLRVSASVLPQQSDAARNSFPQHGGLCRETQSREIMAVLVNNVVADAFRLGVYDEPAERVLKADGVRLGRVRDRLRNV